MDDPPALPAPPDPDSRGRCERPPLARALRRWRREQDLTQETAAAQLGVSRNYWALLESGRRTPGQDFLRRLALQMGAPAALLQQIASGVPPEGAPAEAGGAGEPQAAAAEAGADDPRAPVRQAYPPYPGYPLYPPYPTPYPAYPAYPPYPEYPAYPPRARRRLRRPPRRPGRPRGGAGPVGGSPPVSTNP